MNTTNGYQSGNLIKSYENFKIYTVILEDQKWGGHDIITVTPIIVLVIFSSK